MVRVILTISYKMNFLLNPFIGLTVLAVSLTKILRYIDLVVRRDSHADAFALPMRGQDVLSVPRAVHPSLDRRFRYLRHAVPFIMRHVIDEIDPVIEIVLKEVFRPHINTLVLFVI